MIHIRMITTEDLSPECSSEVLEIKRDAWRPEVTLLFSAERLPAPLAEKGKLFLCHGS
jgi:hypothetical protein